MSYIKSFAKPGDDSRSNPHAGPLTGPTSRQIPLYEDRALIVTGSLSSNPSDRWLDRTQIQPVQVILDGETHIVHLFHPIGPLGISSFAFRDPESSTAPIYFSSGSDLKRIDIETRKIVDCAPSELVDVHEIAIENDEILIANTGRDEAIIYSPANGNLLRIPLEFFRQSAISDFAANQEVIDHFHINQVFRGMRGNLWALVHHSQGRQSRRRTVGKIIKSHGNGGVLNLDRKFAINLNLAAPHSVRIVQGQYWLMNSARNQIAVYSADWHLQRSISTIGWGRGLAISNEFAYIGISPIRKRYIPFHNKFTSQPMIQTVDVSTGRSLALTSLEHIEQINNVYCVHRSVAHALLGLSGDVS